MLRSNLYLASAATLFATAAALTLFSPIWIVPRSELSAWPFSLPLLGVAAICSLLLYWTAAKAEVRGGIFFLSTTFTLVAAWHSYVVLLNQIPDVPIERAGLYETQALYMTHIVIIHAPFLAAYLVDLIRRQGRVGSE